MPRHHSRNTSTESVSDVVRSILSAASETVQLDTFRPIAQRVVKPIEDEIPTSIDELPISLSHCYDLSVTAAAQLNIPVVGSISGGLSRRVVVGERSAYKPITKDSVERRYGYAIRMCVTVNKWDAELKVNIPFLAASAQLGVIEAGWMFQVVGLAGPKIDVNLPPTKLDVETFVIAQQGLERIISAIRDPTTKFLVSIVGETKPIDQVARELRASVIRSYGITSIEDGRTLEAACKRLQPDAGDSDTLSDLYRTVAGITSPAEKPSEAARKQAVALLGRIRADV